MIKNICAQCTHTTHTYPGEEEIEIKSFFRKYKLINNESAVWHARETHSWRERRHQVDDDGSSEKTPEKKRITYTNTHAERGIKCFFTSSSIFVVVIIWCICCCLLLSTASSSSSMSTSSSFLVNNLNTHTDSHANTYKHGLNFNVKWRATKYNGNLSKFHYDIPLHNVIRAVVFFFGKKTFFVSTTLFHTLLVHVLFVCCGWLSWPLCVCASATWIFLCFLSKLPVRPKNYDCYCFMIALS